MIVLQNQLRIISNDLFLSFVWGQTLLASTSLSHPLPLCGTPYGFALTGRNWFCLFYFIIVLIFMKALSDSLRKTMAHKHWGKNIIWAIAFNEVKAYFDGKLKIENWKFWEDTLNLEWHVRFNKLFLKTSDPQIKIDIFQQKQKILARVNAAIAKVGYTTKIVDIMVK